MKTMHQEQWGMTAVVNTYGAGRLRVMWRLSWWRAASGSLLNVVVASAGIGHSWFLWPLRFDNGLIQDTLNKYRLTVLYMQDFPFWELSPKESRTRDAHTTQV
jgi:hypothetical protein